MEATPDRLRPGSTSREELILSTAVTDFAQRGYDGTSLREIATSAGISPSLLSHRFRAKLLFLTKPGTDTYDAIEMKLDLWGAEVFAGVSDDDVSAALGVFAALDAPLGHGRSQQCSAKRT